MSRDCHDHTLFEIADRRYVLRKVLGKNANGAEGGRLDIRTPACWLLDLRVVDVDIERIAGLVDGDLLAVVSAQILSQVGTVFAPC